MSCTGSGFGGDPLPGVPKQCFCKPMKKDGVSRCATEGGTCKCKGTVFYGKNNESFTSVKTGKHSTMKASGSIPCNSGVFGGDPVPGE